MSQSVARLIVHFVHSLGPPLWVTPLSILTLHGWQVRGFSLRENALVRGANGHVQRKPPPRILNGVTRHAPFPLRPRGGMYRRSNPLVGQQWPKFPDDSS